MLHFRCSHGLSNAASVTPTFKARDHNDRRIRKADRLLAGEGLVRALIRHVAVNGTLRGLEVSAAPLRLFDWQSLGAALKTNGCPLRELTLAGSRLGDTGLAAIGPALLEKKGLVHLDLCGCSLTSDASYWLVTLLQDSNVRQNEGRRVSELQSWAAGLRDYSKVRRVDVDESGVDPPIGLEKLLLAGNDLGAKGAIALAHHMAHDYWLRELDLRRNGIDLQALAQLRAAVVDRETAEGEKLTVMQPLTLRLDGNAQDSDKMRRDDDIARRRGTTPRGAGFDRIRPSSAAPSFHEMAARNAAAKRPSSARPAWGAQTYIADRKKLNDRRRSAADKASSIDRVVRGAKALAHPKRGPALSADDWDELVAVSGGATPLLDAMEGLLFDLIADEQKKLKAHASGATGAHTSPTRSATGDATGVGGGDGGMGVGGRGGMGE